MNLKLKHSLAVGKKIKGGNNHTREPAQEKVDKKETRDPSGTQDCDIRGPRVPRQEQAQETRSTESLFSERERMIIMSSW